MHDRYDVAIVLNYYRPYVSGLTETAAVVAEGLAARGWRVAAVAAQHDAVLPRVDSISGVDVFRARVMAKIGKGVVSTSFLTLARRVLHQSSVANLHLPMLEAGLVARLAGRTPVVVTYQCDVNLTDSALDRLIIATMDASNRVAMRRASAVIVSSMDYAKSSRIARALPADPDEVSPPAVLRQDGRPRFRETDGPHVGFLGRIVEEKGLQYLVRAFRRTDDPSARLLVGGDYENVAGGSVIDRVRAAIGDDPRVRILGYVPDKQLSDFYASLDVFALPSVNSLEAFGIVQVEAMLAGVPVVASDLPGVRMPIEATGFGRLARPRDVEGLAAALELVLAEPGAFWEGPRHRAAEKFSVAGTIDGYERVFRSVAPGLRR